MKWIIATLLRLHRERTSVVLVENSKYPNVQFENGQDGYAQDSLLDVLALEWRLKYELVDGCYTITLAKGWHLQQANITSAWQYIHDAKGYRRGLLMRDFANRVPYLFVYCRFRHELVYDPKLQSKFVQIIDAGTETPLMVSRPILRTEDANYYERCLRTQLEHTYPSYRNPFAYWESYGEIRRPS